MRPPLCLTVHATTPPDPPSPLSPSTPYISLRVPGGILSDRCLLPDAK